MEKKAAERLLDAGIDLLGTLGARHATARAAEDAAGLPHGTMRHHFGDQQRYLLALTRRLLSRLAPTVGETPQQMLDRWLTAERLATRALLEVTLLGLRDPAVGNEVRTARERVRDMVAGHYAVRADAVSALLDGAVLDALLHDRSTVDLVALVGEPDR